MAEWLYICILSGLIGSSLSMDRCSWMILSCAEHKRDLLQSAQLFEDPEQLEGVCRDSLRFRVCINGALKHCREVGGLKYLSKQLLETRLLSHIVCESGSEWRRVYQRSASCVNAQLKKISEKCEQKAFYSDEEVNRPNHHAQMCSDLSRVLLCQASFVSERCGKSAGELYKRLVLHKDELDFFCRDFVREQRSPSPETAAGPVGKLVRALLSLIPPFRVPQDHPSDRKRGQHPHDRVFGVRLENVLLDHVLETRHDRGERSPFFTIQLDPQGAGGPRSGGGRPQKGTGPAGFAWNPRNVKKLSLHYAQNPGNLFTIRIEDDRRRGVGPEFFRERAKSSSKVNPNPDRVEKPGEKRPPFDLPFPPTREGPPFPSEPPPKFAEDEEIVESINSWVRDRAEGLSDRCTGDSTTQELFDAWIEPKMQSRSSMSGSPEAKPVDKSSTRNQLKALFKIPTDHSGGEEILKHWAEARGHHAVSKASRVSFLESDKHESFLSYTGNAFSTGFRSSDLGNSFESPTVSPPSMHDVVADVYARGGSSSSSVSVNQAAECSRQSPRTSVVFKNRTRFILHQSVDGHSLHLGCGYATFEWKRPDAPLRDVLCSWVAPVVSSEFFGCGVQLDAECCRESSQELFSPPSRLRMNLFGVDRYLRLEHIATAELESFCPSRHGSADLISHFVFSDAVSDSSIVEPDRSGQMATPRELSLEEASVDEQAHVPDSQAGSNKEPYAPSSKTGSKKGPYALGSQAGCNKDDRAPASQVGSNVLFHGGARASSPCGLDEGLPEEDTGNGTPEKEYSHSREVHRPQSLFMSDIEDSGQLKTSCRNSIVRGCPEADPEEPKLYNFDTKPDGCHAAVKRKNSLEGRGGQSTSKSKSYSCVGKQTKAIGRSQPNYIILSKPYMPSRAHKPLERVSTTRAKTPTSNDRTTLERKWDGRKFDGASSGNCFNILRNFAKGTKKRYPPIKRVKKSFVNARTNIGQLKAYIKIFERYFVRQTLRILSHIQTFFHSITKRNDDTLLNV